MTEKPGLQNPTDGDWLDALLRRDAARAAHIEDAGFSARVMAALPAPHRSVKRWLLPGMSLLGAAAALALTPAAGYFTTSFAGLFDFRHLSLAHWSVLVPVALMYACSFAAIRGEAA